MSQTAPNIVSMNDFEGSKLSQAEVVSADNSVKDLEPQLINLMQQSEALVALMQGFFHQLDKKRAEEFKIIGGIIDRAKEEIREIGPVDLAQDRFPTAGAELEAITRDTENATHAIMNAAEAVLEMNPSDPMAYKSAVDDEMMKIFEACSFQDITGQRVSKVIGVLKQIEERLGKINYNTGGEVREAPLSAAEIRARDLLLNGPAINGPETSQETIDSMFDSEAKDAASVTQAPMVAEIPVVEAPVVEAPVTEAPIVAKVETPAVQTPVVQTTAVQTTAAAPAPVAKADVPPAVAPAPAPKVVAPVAAPAVVAAPMVTACVVAEEKNSQDDIDSMFENLSEDDLNKANSQDDIDALFD